MPCFIVLHETTLHRYFIFKNYGLASASLSNNAIFPKFIHFVPFSHILVILAVFHTFFVIVIQTTLEQHKFEIQHRSTHKDFIFVNSKYYSTKQFAVGWIQRRKLEIKWSHIYGHLLVIIMSILFVRVFPILVSDRFNVRKCLHYIVWI